MEKTECCICYDDCDEFTICKHPVHYACMKSYGKNICPLCRQKKCIDKSHFISSPIDDDIYDPDDNIEVVEEEDPGAFFDDSAYWYQEERVQFQQYSTRGSIGMTVIGPG